MNAPDIRIEAAVREGSPYPRGATWDGHGVNFAVFSANATKVEVCLFDSYGHESARIPLPEYRDETWHGYVPEIGPGQVYGYRVHGPFAPEEGHPAERKRRMARAVVERYHHAEAAAGAEARFDQLFKRHEVPEDVPEAAVPDDALRHQGVSLPHLLALLGLEPSISAARRDIRGGAVKVGGVVVEDPEAVVPRDAVLGKVVQVGKRRMIRIAP